MQKAKRVRVVRTRKRKKMNMPASRAHENAHAKLHACKPKTAMQNCMKKKQPMRAAKNGYQDADVRFRTQAQAIEYEW